jgi:hypothetical protein
VFYLFYPGFDFVNDGEDEGYQDGKGEEILKSLKVKMMTLQYRSKMVLLLFNGDPKKEPFYGDYAFQGRNAKVYHEGKAKIDIKKFAQLIDNIQNSQKIRLSKEDLMDINTLLAGEIPFFKKTDGRGSQFAWQTGSFPFAITPRR